MPRKSTSRTDARPPVAVSYLRFSTPEQAKGDSLRRQTEDSERWCQCNSIPLDQTISDLGRSAYHGRHRDDKAALGKFLELVRQNRIPRGSFLIVENLDRLSREDERTALRLWMDILDAGVNIVQLHPETVFRHDKSDMLDMMRAIIELSRGHSESRMKAVRAAANWEKRYRRARETGAVLTAWLPAWVQLGEEGRPELIAERAETVRKAFVLSTAGYGQSSIAKRFRADKVPAFGPTGEWSAEYIRRILKDRRAIGELQPRKGKDRKADGPPIAGYYPAVVTEQEWLLARAAVSGRRRQKQGRIGADGCANLFGGLLHNARDGDTYIVAQRTDSGRPVRVVVSSNFADGKSPCWSFPLDTLERAVLSLLRELDPKSILPAKDDVPDSAAVLESEMAWVRERQETLKAELLRGDSRTVADVLRGLETRETELVNQLDEIKERAVRPAKEDWKDAHTLIDLLDTADDPADIRLRLRSALRRIVASIWLLVVPRGRDRLAAAQIWFAGGEKHRDYLVFHRPARANATSRTEGGWWAGSIVSEDANALDLRRPADVQEMTLALEQLDLADMNGECPVGRAITLRLAIRSEGRRVRELALKLFQQEA